MLLTTQLKTARWLLLAVLITFAFWRFSEPTGDPDLWGHVIYGQRTLQAMGVEHTEPFSWTALGHRWVNHELIAELVMGAVHSVTGGSGLFWLMLILSFSAFGLAIKLGRTDQCPAIIVWLVALLMCREVAIGFAMRPQLFSALLFVVFLGCLRALFNAARWPILALPLLLCVWINTHGAALLALVLLLISIIVSSIGTRITRLAPKRAKPHLRFAPITLTTWAYILITTALCWLAVGITPYGYGLLGWLIDSVRYIRPEIAEWNSTALSAQHLFFFISFPVFAFLSCSTRQIKRPWEIATITVLFIAAVRHERHIPLYALAYIVITPNYLNAFLCTESVKRWCTESIQPNSFKIALLNCILLVSVVVFAWQGLLTRANEGLRMQVPRAEYPVAAMQFLNESQLSGNSIVNFNWAQMALWELPQFKTSFDGRLDTCYPLDLINAHWRFFYDGILSEKAFDLDQADIILIPPWIAANRTLKTLPNWRKIYQDPLSTIYLNTTRNPKWTSAITREGLGATRGNSNFPDTKCLNAQQLPSNCK
jgi:hypothetical protein